ncbi:MAG: DegV family protein [Chloroflexota bacterium]
MIKIVVDSTCDLPSDLLQRHQITVVPINIQFGTETFKEGVDLDQTAFYRKVEANHMLPKTSQPSPGEFIAVYQRIAAAGDTLLSMHVTGKLSGTCQSAELAATQLRGQLDVRVFDSWCGSAGLGYMALEAARMAEGGQSIDEIIQRMEAIRPRVNIFLSPENLKYLQMSGRVSNAQAVIGSMLSMKPIIALDKGMLNPAARIRTRSKAIEHMLTLTREKVGDQPINLAIVHAEAPSDAAALMQRAQALFNVKESFVEDLATSLAVHFGPGCLGIVSYVV